MANTAPSTYMSLPVPIVGVDPGPTYATDLNSCFTLLDAHTHSPGSGQQITPNGINISSDLTFANNNATSLRSVRLYAQSAALAGVSDLACLYQTGTGGDLYYNDGSGNQVRITQSGGVAGTPGSIGSLASPASATYVAGSTKFVWQSDTNKAASMDSGALLIRETGLASANSVTVQSAASLAASYTLTLPTALPGSSQYLTSSSSGTLSFSTADTIVLGITSTGSNSISAARTRATGTTVAAGGVAISASSGSFGTTSTSLVDVTNLSVTITTSGRPVFVGLMPDGNGSSFVSQLQIYSGLGITDMIGTFVFKRGVTEIARTGVQIIVQTSATENLISSAVPAGSFFVIDAVAAGTYTYKMQASTNSASAEAFVQFSKLTVYEL